MKNQFIITVVFIAIISFTNQLFAQEATSKQTGWDIKKNVKCRISATDSGCTISFENSPQSEKFMSKKGYDYYQAQSAFSVSSSDNSVTEVISPRDAASGQATGRRMHKPLAVNKDIDKSTPVLYEKVSNTGVSTMDAAISGSGGGAGKATFKEMTITKRCAGKITKISCDSGECDIPIGDCPNGDCNLTASWSWGESNSVSKGCSVDFLLKIEDGVCTKMAISEQGMPKKDKKK